MCLYVAGPAQRPKVAGIKSQGLHIHWPTSGGLNRSNVMDFRCDGRTIIQQAILTEGMQGKVCSPETPPAMTIH